MHFVNNLSSKASIRVTITNVDVIEHNSALRQINRLSVNN